MFLYVTSANTGGKRGGGGSQQDKVEVNTSHCLSATRINTGEMNEQKRIMSKFTSTRMNKVAALIKRQW